MRPDTASGGHGANGAALPTAHGLGVACSRSLISFPSACHLPLCPQTPLQDRRGEGHKETAFVAFPRFFFLFLVNFFLLLFFPITFLRNFPSCRICLEAVLVAPCWPPGSSAGPRPAPSGPWSRRPHRHPLFSGGTCPGYRLPISRPQAPYSQSVSEAAWSVAP